MSIILASLSPRRTELLNLIHINHKVIPSTIKETIDYKMSPEDIVQSLADQKASDVASKYPNDIIIGADTIVTINNEILGKPKNYEEAFKMLSMLSGNTHKVITGVCIIVKDKKIKFSCTSDVEFSKMSDEEIREYIYQENVYDKAGSYAIQGICAKYIKKIDGDYYNIMGLPLNSLYQTLKENKIIK